MKYAKHSITFAFYWFFLSISMTSHADIVREIDFENGKVGPAGSYPDLNPSGNNPEIVAAQNGVSPRSGNYMMRTYLNRETSSTNFRTEVRLQQDFDKGKEYWLGISVFLPKDWSLNYGSNGSEGPVWQFHDYAYENSSWRTLLPLTARHTQDGWQIRNNTLPGSSINQTIGLGNLKAFSTTVPYKLGQWNDFVLNVKFSGAQSANDTNGFIKVWVNGQLVVNQTGQNYFGEQTKGPYFKFGLYMPRWKFPAEWSGPSSRLLYHDELRVGDASSSYAEVSPGSVPVPVPDSGSSNVAAPPSPPANIQAN
jgi:hypothetical protein